jgi:putative restriction endonuclease
MVREDATSRGSKRPSALLSTLKQDGAASGDLTSRAVETEEISAVTDQRLTESGVCFRQSIRRCRVRGVEPFIALTDKEWFDFLAARSRSGIVDEVNFWSPRSKRPMRQMDRGELVFFRLKRQHAAIAGYGFFAAFHVLSLDTAWELFGWKNGDPDKIRFLHRIGAYRQLDLLDPRAPREPIGCTMLRNAVFWPKDRWLPWGERMGWAPNIVQGKTETDPERVDLLLREVSLDAPEELEMEEFLLVDTDERSVVTASQVEREGQGVFRVRLLEAYARRCAITGEHTEPVLDAAHIQPYLGPRSNHVQNGLLLTKEFHALFDRGYVTITPDYVVRVSPRLRAEWQNGRRYYPYDGKQLENIPLDARQRPSEAALEWHEQHVFKSVA